MINVAVANASNTQVIVVKSFKELLEDKEYDNFEKTLAKICAT